MIDRYTRAAMKDLWSLENKFRVWLEVELAVCEGWYQLGEIPDQDMQIIRDRADFDLERILELENTTKHDVIAFLTAVEEKVGSASRYIHLGCTSSDIVDTANSVLLKRAGRIIEQDITDLLDELNKMAHEHQGLLMMGRTHGIHAEPTSFGLKLAGFYAEFERHLYRWQNALEDISVGKLSGAVGTYAHLTPGLEEIVCHHLGLKPDPISTQIVQRDRYAHYFTTLGLIGGGVERLAVELRHLQRTELMEVEEGFSSGQKGSSAMPHKKNPISAENLSGLARLLRSNSLAAMENMALWHERDISHSSVERVIMPDSTILADYILNRMKSLLENLRVRPENMQKNLRSSFELYFSQRILLALVHRGLKRQKAYELVQKTAMNSWENKISFPKLIREDSEVKKYLNKNDLAEIFDNSFYLQNEAQIFAKVFSMKENTKHTK